MILYISSACYLLVLTMSGRATAFMQPLPHVSLTTNRPRVFNTPYSTHPSLMDYSRSPTPLFMYNLPPDNDRNGLGSFLPSIVSIVALGLFFFSPLGALFFAVTNTLFAFAILTPFILYAGFQVWQYFYTIEGPCPTCGAPVRVLKEGQDPSICFNCGSQVIANGKLDGVELYDDLNNIIDRQRSIWDAFFSNEDVGFSSYPSTSTDVKEISKRVKREQTIIDVDVTDEK